MWGCGLAITIFRHRMRTRAGTACKSSFSYQDGSSGESKELRLNSKDLTTALSTEIWRRCVQRSPKNSHAYPMDAVSFSVCKAQVFYIWIRKNKQWRETLYYC